MKVFISVFTLSQLIKFAILVLKALANQLHECKSYKLSLESCQCLKLLINSIDGDSLIIIIIFYKKWSYNYIYVIHIFCNNSNF